jgi:hypothetical protein
MAARAFLEAHNRGQELWVLWGGFAVREGHDQPHAQLVVWHATNEKQAILREVAYFRNVLDIDQAGIERAYPDGQGQPDTLSPAGLFRLCPAPNRRAIGEENRHFLSLATDGRFSFKVVDAAAFGP